MTEMVTVPKRMGKYKLTKAHRAQLAPWRDKWIANTMSTAAMTEVDREVCRDAVVRLYRAADLPPPKNIVFVASPLVARFASGFAAWSWYCRKNARPTVVTINATHAATYSATRQATHQATYATTRDATEAAIHRATYAATSKVTYKATDAAIYDAIYDAINAATDAPRQAIDATTSEAISAATINATLEATYEAIRVAAWTRDVDDATRDAIHLATKAATEDEIHAAIRAATSDVTNAATHEATHAAIDGAVETATRADTLAAIYAATYAAIHRATYAATRDATEAATLAATYDGTNIATDVTIRDAICDAIRDATHNETSDAIYAATSVATSAATHEATYVATDDATEAATYDTTYAATLAATREAIDAATREATHAPRQAIDAAAIRAATDFATNGTTHKATVAAIRDAIAAATRNATYATTYSATVGVTYDATDDATRDATRDAIYDTTQSLDNWYVVPKDFAVNLRGPGLECTKKSFLFYQGGNFWSSFDAFISFFRHIAKLPIDYEKWDAWETLSLHSGPRAVHADFCIISDRPEVLLVDDQNRPHCDSGPFCRWRDGFSLYAFRGVRVPAFWIEQRHRLTPEMALSQENVELRRAACELIGWARILTELKSRVIDTDPDPEIGQLLEVMLPDSGPERFLKVRCGTGREFVIPVPPTSKTALEANAWTYGLSSTDYKPEFRT